MFSNRKNSRDFPGGVERNLVFGKSTYLAIVKAPETIVSKARTNETDDTYNIKRIAYREKFYSL